MDSAAIAGPKRAEKHRFGGLRGHVAGTSETFQTVSQLEFSEPKNANRRAVGLPTRAVGALQRHAERQAGEIEAAGDGYDHAGLVFANRTGGPLDAQNVVNRDLKPLLETADLPPIRFHDLRHSCLSLLSERGEPIRDLQALAGHASAAFTLQRYTHHYGTPASRTARAMYEALG